MDSQEMLDQLICNAREALAAYEPYTQEQVDDLVKAMCVAFKEHAEELSRECVDETGLGDYDSKVIKNSGSPDGVWYANSDEASPHRDLYRDLNVMHYWHFGARVG